MNPQGAGGPFNLRSDTQDAGGVFNPKVIIQAKGLQFLNRQPPGLH